ncbi:unnamed protein product [Cyclocybe aegerita]|uniref:Indole-diterpene biosynthesis protein PaxU n=1 Tax=Cyclocybe aegerita TaxID=1973307 RepID=A0A8S0XH22_CYCAE|nr:unnamed protein product [Cyclocybe aegerita]
MNVNGASPPKLQKLNSQLFLLEPGGHVPDSSPNPAVVLVFSWMDASLKNVQKYSDKLASLFPTSKIILSMMTSDFYWASQRSREESIRPILSVLRWEHEHGTLRRGIFLHMMSNAGGIQLAVLRKLLAQSPLTLDYHPPVALSLDSLPGDNGLESALLSFAPQNPIFRFLSLPFLTTLYGIFYAFSRLRGDRPLFAEIREAVAAADTLPSITEAPVPGTTSSVPRLYVYSEADRVVLAKHVKRAIEEAIEKGYDVRVERFEKSAHVAHARADPERYWKAVEELWVRATRESDGKRDVRL